MASALVLPDIVNDRKVLKPANLEEFKTFIYARFLESEFENF